MRIATGKVVAGNVVLDNAVLLEGAAVYVVQKNASAYAAEISLDEMQEIEAGLAELEAGDVIDGDVVMARLRKRA